jgi:hypothetical protein
MSLLAHLSLFLPGKVQKHYFEANPVVIAFVLRNDLEQRDPWYI